MKIRIAYFIVGILLILNYLFNWQMRDSLLEFKYLLSFDDKYISDKSKIDKILSEFEILKYEELSPDYLKYTKSDNSKYKKLISNLKFFKINRNHLNQKIVGNFRLKEFICKDKFYRQCILNQTDHIICVLNPTIFYKLLELMNEMDKMKYDTKEIFITDGHRHPKNNEEIKGAKLSRHIKGEAIDFIVGDINNDGDENGTDKEQILKLLEDKIIKNEGGIGRYPGTQSLHFDVRGYRARWDSY